MRYLTDWRMHLAEDLLATTDLGVAAVAFRVGYDAGGSIQSCLQTDARRLAESVALPSSAPERLTPRPGSTPETELILGLMFGG